MSYNFLTDTDSTLNKNIKEVIKRDYHKEDDRAQIEIDKHHVNDPYNSKKISNQLSIFDIDK